MQIHIEKYFPRDQIHCSESCAFIRLDPLCPDEIDNFLHAGFSLTHIPMLSARAHSFSRTLDQHLLDKLLLAHTKAALALKRRGYQRVVLAADDDGHLQQLLSPRFFIQNLKERSAPLLSLFEQLSLIIEDLWVSLTYEELAPGGFDATDGHYVLEQLENRGLKCALIAAGTRDFPALYQRKITQKKEEAQVDFCSNEPGLATAQWAALHKKISIWALASIADEEHALKLARAIGLEGLVKRAPDILF